MVDCYYCRFAQKDISFVWRDQKLCDFHIVEYLYRFYTQIVMRKIIAQNAFEYVLSVWLQDNSLYGSGANELRS